MRYFYAAIFAAVAVLMLTYAAACFQEGVFYVRGASFRRSTQAPAFWLCMIVVCGMAIVTLILAGGLMMGYGRMR